MIGFTRHAPASVIDPSNAIDQAMAASLEDRGTGNGDVSQATISAVLAGRLYVDEGVGSGVLRVFLSSTFTGRTISMYPLPPYRVSYQNRSLSPDVIVFLFVTVVDTEQERNALIEKAIPRIKAYARRQGP